MGLTQNHRVIIALQYFGLCAKLTNPNHLEAEFYVSGKWRSVLSEQKKVKYPTSLKLFANPIRFEYIRQPA